MIDDEQLALTGMPERAVLAIDERPSNAELIVDCARLGYLRREWRTLDPTYGLGVFWQQWRPDVLVASDLDPAKSPTGTSVDATHLPHPDRSFPSVVIDGPYKLNGTPTASVDGRYGVHEPTRWQDRMILLERMLTEGARVLGDAYLLYKCMDQVCSSKVRWQTFVFTRHAMTLGLGLVDRLDQVSYRPQPHGVRQLTARRNASTMLVFQRGWTS